MRIVDVVREVAAARGGTPAQVALAWVSSRGGGVPDVVAIPGTRRPARLEENVGALEVTLTDDDLVPAGAARRAGGRRPLLTAGGRYRRVPVRPGPEVDQNAWRG